ncbi:MAG: DUF2480 family protein [Chitinophagaceae bacterium]|nr:DUF2480 family protein [Chitinophagaceae bacterium]
MSDVIVNKVAESALITIDLEDYLPVDKPEVFDLKDHLFMGLMLKEKEFRTALLHANWQQYAGKTVLVLCSADAIVPVWAYMLAASYLQPVAAEVHMETEDAWRTRCLLEAIQKMEANEFADKRVVIKGCGDQPIPEAAYLEITTKLQPVAKSIMYGEPCSTVPIYKKK